MTGIGHITALSRVKALFSPLKALENQLQTIEKIEKRRESANSGNRGDSYASEIEGLKVLIEDTSKLNELNKVKNQIESRSSLLNRKRDNDLKSEIGHLQKRVKDSKASEAGKGITGNVRGIVKTSKAIANLEGRMKRIKDLGQHLVDNVDPKTDVSSYNDQLKNIQKLIDARNKLQNLEVHKTQRKKTNPTADLSKLRRKISEVKKEIKAIEKTDLGKSFRKSIGKTFTPLSTLETQLEKLKEAKNKAFSVEQIKHYNKAIASAEKNISKRRALNDRKPLGKRLRGKLMTPVSEKASSLVTSTISFVKSSIGEAAKLRDKMTEVGLQTGYSKKQMESLVGKIDEISTRTSKIDLLSMTELSGKHKLPEKEMMNLVKNADKLNLVLGKSFGGGYKQLATDLLSLKGSFKDTKSLEQGDMLNKGGSALNALKKSGVSSPSDVLAYVKNRSKTGTAVNFEQELAIGATLHGANLVPKEASDSVTKLLGLMGKKPKGFLTLLDLTSKQFKHLLANNPAELLNLLGKRFKNVSNPELVKTLDMLGVKGKGTQGVVDVVSGMSKNTQNYENHKKTIGSQIQNPTSLNNDYTALNSNLPASLDIMQKGFTNLKTTIGQGLSPIIMGLGKIFNQLGIFMKKNWHIIEPVLVGIGIYIGLIAIKMAILAIASAPISLIALAIIALIAVVYALYKNWDKVVNYLKNSAIGKFFIETFNTIKESISKAFSWIWDKGMRLLRFLGLAKKESDKLNNTKKQPTPGPKTDPNIKAQQEFKRKFKEKSDKRKDYRKWRNDFIEKSRQKKAEADLKKKTDAIKTDPLYAKNNNANNTNIQQGMQQVSSSGVKEKNYHITFESFVKGGLNVNTDTMTSSINQVEDEFMSMFLRVLNNTQQA